MKAGDLVRFVSKNYGTPERPVKDQWVGVTGLIVEIHKKAHPIEMTVLVVHPDDGYPTEVFAFGSDVRVLSELTDEQLEHVVGGRSSESFEKWRIETINRHGGSGEGEDF